MADGSSVGAVASALGLKYATLVAGFAGGVVSLSYLRELTRMQSGLAVVTGTLVAGYLTPVIGHYMDLSAVLENGVAFGVGLTSMNIVPGLLHLSEKFRDDPAAFIRRGGDK